MRAYAYIVAIGFVAFARASYAGESPVVFARSGQETTISVGNHDDRSIGAVGLWTFGQKWGEPIEVRNGVIEIMATKVRAPLVFRLKATHDNKMDLGELVVYPDRPPVDWDKNTQLIAAATPNWFNTWSDAVGLPIRKFGTLKSLAAENWRMQEKPALLVVGEEAVQSDLARVGRLAAEYQINVFVLATDWFATNETASRKMVVSPKEAVGPLADLQDQTWPLPPVFRRRSLRILDRQTWLAGSEHPLVEEIRGGQKGVEALRTVISYLPWQQQLGRTETADALFLRLLTETAKGAPDRSSLVGHWRLLYPAATDIKSDDRPVLAAAMKAAVEDVDDEAEPSQICAYVLDLRGKSSLASDFFEKSGVVHTIEARIGPGTPLLILGDDPTLDTWTWLGLDRSRGRSRRAGVVWRPDDSLPPSIESQLRLMQLFTDWNIPLENISEE